MSEGHNWQLKSIARKNGQVTTSQMTREKCTHLPSAAFQNCLPCEYRQCWLGQSPKRAISNCKLEKVGTLQIEVLESPRLKDNERTAYQML